MDQYAMQVIRTRVERTVDALNKNNFDASIAESRDALWDKLMTYIKPGDVIASGGSMTVNELGLIDKLKAQGYKYLDAFADGVSLEERFDIYRQHLLSDVYLMSSNAVTSDGCLYNVDGNSNRVAALCYGPKSVIVICGYNKIAETLDDAVTRVNTTAAPMNAVRLSRKTPCSVTARCADCRGDDRICCNYVVSRLQRLKGRIKVIFLLEELGY